MTNTSTGRTSRLNHRVRPDVMRRLKLYALTQGVSEASAVDQLLDDALPPLPPVDLDKRRDR